MIRQIHIMVRICIALMLLAPLLLASLKYTGGSIQDYENGTYTRVEVEQIAWKERKRALEVSAFEFNRSYLIWHSIPLIILVIADWQLGRIRHRYQKPSS